MKKLSENDIQKHLKNLNGWEFENGSITKTYQFNNFKEAFAVMTRIAFECEGQNHHPNWKNVYNSLSIELNTHEANGVTEKDFKLAKSIEAITASK